MQIPQIIYGTAWKKDLTESLVEKAFQAGYRAIDTANQPKHYSEEGVGRAVKKFLLNHPRESLFLQTKFTSINGQDHRIPYDRSRLVSDQVIESFESSLSHLGVTHLDSLLLHGPYHHPGLGPEDYEVWRSLENLYEQGRVKAIGISNVNARQLGELVAFTKVRPHFVQNRVYAITHWDKGVRTLCQKQGIHYQGFSLLTANPDIVASGTVTNIARRAQATPAQTIFSFAKRIGIIPLTGTTNPLHMAEDLDYMRVELSDIDVESILALVAGYQ